MILKNLLKPVLALLLSSLILFACKSNSGGYERSRREYDYVPPVIQPTQIPVPTPNPVVEQENNDVSEENGEKKRGFFARIFSREKDEEATVARVGDDPEGDISAEGDETAKDTPTDNIYRLKKGDTLYITLSGSGGLNEEIQTVIDGEGGVKLRFIGTVKATGLSSTELEREIEAEYTERQKIYKDLTVRVVVPNTFYSIGGEVRQPGRFPLVGRVTLSQAVVASGNFTEWANEKDITLVRNKERVNINFRKIRENPNLDVELLAGDVVWVGRSTF